MTDWQDISTAPKKGEFLVWMPDEPEQRKMQVMSIFPYGTIIGGNFDYDLTKPTHWMLLPNPPKTQAPE